MTVSFTSSWQFQLIRKTATIPTAVLATLARSKVSQVPGYQSRLSVGLRQEADCHRWSMVCSLPGPPWWRRSVCGIPWSPGCMLSPAVRDEGRVVRGQKDLVN